jgi:hypothetical protein
MTYAFLVFKSQRLRYVADSAFATFGYSEACRESVILMIWLHSGRNRNNECTTVFEPGLELRPKSRNGRNAERCAHLRFNEIQFDRAKL